MNRQSSENTMDAKSTYKVVELSMVTDEAIEDALNSWTHKGWMFESLHFAMGTGSKRPAMAFLFFTNSLEPGESEEGGETTL